VVLILAVYLWKAPIRTQKPFFIRTRTEGPLL
jgi:hypothetical protein